MFKQAIEHKGRIIVALTQACRLYVDLLSWSYLMFLPSCIVIPTEEAKLYQIRNQGIGCAIQVYMWAGAKGEEAKNTSWRKQRPQTKSK